MVSCYMAGDNGGWKAVLSAKGLHALHRASEECKAAGNPSRHGDGFRSRAASAFRRKSGRDCAWDRSSQQARCAPCREAVPVCMRLLGAD